MTVEIRALERSDDRQALFSPICRAESVPSSTYVAVEAERILGFVTVSPGSLDADDLASGQKTPPYPVPILRLARLAVDTSARGRGLERHFFVS